ncbi:MAG: hypothetical protein LBH74_00340 [Nitrososphaerota archaeon]|jgi:hypothetical protein|uniref:hypothetical protein n=1 Tax=Candidatus Bathycorpusculum sp. TaxID=2994959 RepID=UPI002834992F|nr:hypothetical protein [Candidatus Termitimicrobium sp.]MDR0492080.1 hypothetical protein [Nitrososphaerota archaeon]
MIKRKLSVFLIISLILSITLPFFIASVSSSSGSIIINNKTASTPSQQIQAGDKVNLYFGGVTWTGDRTVLLLATDNKPSASSGYIYTPSISVYDITDNEITHSYDSPSGVWVVGSYWINGTIPATTTPGNYYIKALDDITSRTAVTDTYLTVNAIAYNTTLSISPSEGPGGIPITFTGSGYPVGERVSIQYYDPAFNRWQLMTETIADVGGQIRVDSVAPDLKKSVGSYDNFETYTQIEYRSQILGVSSSTYGYASYNEYARGLKTVGNQTASGLFGNGTNLQSVKTMVGDTLVISGKWFHSNDQIYIRWDSDAIVGTVTSDEWANAKIIGSPIASKNGSFSTTVTIPETAHAGEHYLSIEDSEARVAIKIYVSKAHLQLSPPSGPGGTNVQFTGSLYPANTAINIYYLDPTFNNWNYWTNTTSDSTGKISFSTKIPDLQNAGYSFDSNMSTAISFRAEINGIPYAYADYTQYWRGIKQIGNQIAYGVFGDGMNLSTIVNVRPGDNLTISGSWFHSSDVIYIRFDGNQLIGTSYIATTLTSDEWAKAQIIGTTTANAAGSFETTITIPQVFGGAHYIAFEDSQRRVTLIITVTAPGPNPTPSPTTQPTTNPTPPPTLSPTPSRPIPNIDLSCMSTVTGDNFRVNINGVLSLNGNPLSDVSVLISYSVTGGRTWESLSLAQTSSDGSYGVVWKPDVTGNYLIKAEVEATQTTATAEKTINLALTLDNPESPESNIFTINSNSTIRQFRFDPDNNRLSFTAEGPTGTTGYVNIYIPKATLSNISKLKAYIDNHELVDFSSESKGDSWLISFSYTHSIHTITMDLDAPSSNTPSDSNADWTTYAVVITIILMIVIITIGAIVHKRKKQKR